MLLAFGMLLAFRMLLSRFCDVLGFCAKPSHMLLVCLGAFGDAFGMLLGCVWYSLGCFWNALGFSWDAFGF